MAIDTTCAVWNSSCGKQGSCALYDNDEFRNKFVTFQFIARSLASVCQIVCLVIGRNKTDWTLDKLDSDESELDVEIKMLNRQTKDMEAHPDISEPSPIFKGNKVLVN